MIRELKNTYKVTELCSLLGVSTSGYYTWTRGGRGKRSQANIELGERIKQIHQRSRSTYGSPRITRELHAQGIRCGHNGLTLGTGQRPRCSRRWNNGNHGFYSHKVW